MTTPLHQGVSWVLVFDEGVFDRSVMFDNRRDADVWSWGYRSGRQSEYECALVYPFASWDIDHAARVRYPDELRRAIALSLWGME